MIERARTADLLPVDEHRVLSAYQFECTIGNVALVGVVARGIALPVENRHRLHRSFDVLHQLSNDPGPGNAGFLDRMSRNRLSQLRHARLDVTKAAGSFMRAQANAALTERDALWQEIARALIPIRTDTRSPDSFSIQCAPNCSES